MIAHDDDFFPNLLDTKLAAWVNLYDKILKAPSVAAWEFPPLLGGLIGEFLIGFS